MSESVSRSVWMSTQGAEIYENWNAALLNTCDTPAFWDKYADSLTDSCPNANTVYFGLRHLINSPEPSIFSAGSDTWTGLINRWDLDSGISETYLGEHQSGILHYTSAQDMTRKFKITSNEPQSDIKKVILHAWDGLQFGLGFPVAVAGDTYFATHNITPERQRTEGHWQKRTQFISEALRNTSFITSMEELRVTGFDVLTDHARLDLMPIKGDGSWLKRAQIAGLTDVDSKQITSLLEYDPTSNTFTPKTRVMRHLREKLKEQNITGLDEKQKATAGNIASLGTPVSRGCPVRTAIGRTCLFASKATAILADNT